ncbi:hypothetical protein NSU_4883 [Novosphingobium pentaromativorans US6-1]|uniref:Lipoprotein n=1 Tax=Novosphingobium pentaromativorans US6-1 TaxID=1088721 RepID=G6EKL2_9SPHN|nr:hypothetical protein NSU_4883 [Novosphingobium pentaromativorans US6-1]
MFYMKWVPIIGAALLLAGCAGNKSMYEWGNYQPALVRYAKNADKASFEQDLRETIAKGEEKGRVAPGIYAELGYLLLEEGKGPEAALLFTKERERFPESAVLMNKLIEGSGPNHGETDQ